MRSRPFSALLLAMIFASPRVAIAQTASLIGTVLADSTERPLPQAEVAFPTLGRYVRTDSAGNFRIDGLPAGTHALVIRLIGYAPLATTLTFKSADKLERDFMLTVRPVNLAPVEVAGEKPGRYRLVDFVERKKFGIGHFLTAEVFEENRDHRVGDILASKLPGIITVSIGSSKQAAVSSRGQISLKMMPAGDLMDRRQGAPVACYVNVWIDGIHRYFARKDESLFDLNEFAPDEIAAVEYYAAAETPARFNSSNSACGTLVIWLKV